MTRCGVNADSEEFHFVLELAPGIAKTAGLGGASRRIIFWIKIEDYGLPLELFKGYSFSVAVFSTDCNGAK